MTLTPLRNSRAMMRGLRAVGHHRDWWVALGQATPNALILGNIVRPWRSDQEYVEWMRWRSGSDRIVDARRLVQTYPNGSIDWWINLAHVLSEPVRFGIGPEYWDDPVICPNLARLVWVPQWSWRSADGAWNDPDARRPARPFPGLEPWMADLAVGHPITCGAWFQRADHGALGALNGPWLIQILLQTVLLQALGGGYWDYLPFRKAGSNEQSS